MDPVTLIVVPGLLGGLVFAFVLFRMGRPRQPGAAERVFRSEPLTTDVINMARIRVAGVGGLGLVAMATVVALFVPRIRQSVALSLVLGVVFASILILWRRRRQSASSSGPAAGAHAMFAIDAPEQPDDRAERDALMNPPDLMALPSAGPL